MLEKNLLDIKFVLWLYTEVQIGANIYNDLPLWELANTQHISRLIMSLLAGFLPSQNIP